MIKFFYPAIITVFMAGCSSSLPKAETNVRSVESNVKVVETNAAANNALVSASDKSNVNAAPSPNANFSIQNFAITKDNVRNTKDKKGAADADTKAIQNATRAVVAAPDNSEVTSAMDAKGQPLETRVFKNHPVLAKVERTNLNNRDIKVFLKNGKVVNLPENLANDFLTASASEIIKAVGVN